MIFGIGNDIVKVSRMEKWVKDEKIVGRYFNDAEIKKSGTMQYLCERYAARFAAKEAFGKALGTGVFIFTLKEIFVTNGKSGEPHFNVTGEAKKIFDRICPGGKIFLSISHEKDYALATVVIEK